MIQEKTLHKKKKKLMTIIMNDQQIVGWESKVKPDEESIEDYAKRTLYGFK